VLSFKVLSFGNGAGGWRSGLLNSRLEFANSKDSNVPAFHMSTERTLVLKFKFSLIIKYVRIGKVIRLPEMFPLVYLFLISTRNRGQRQNTGE
jgi:hypothetical protein